MTREEAKTVFLNRGFIEADNGTYYSPDKWREACVVISEWLEQESTVTSTNNSGEMIYPQVEGITPTVVEPIGDDYKYIKSISKSTGIEFDEEQEELDFMQPHKKIPVTLTVSGYDRLIDLANAIENDDSGYWTNKKISSALKNISSIKQQPCEDAISRQAVLDIQAKYAEYMGATKFWQMCDDIKTLPPANPQEKMGHWITHKEQFNALGVAVKGGVQCSECGYTTHNKLHMEIGCPYKYCPDCGVRMVTPQKESEGI